MLPGLRTHLKAPVRIGASRDHLSRYESSRTAPSHDSYKLHTHNEVLRWLANCKAMRKINAFPRRVGKWLRDDEHECIVIFLIYQNICRCLLRFEYIFECLEKNRYDFFHPLANSIASVAIVCAPTSSDWVHPLKPLYTTRNARYGDLSSCTKLRAPLYTP